MGFMAFQTLCITHANDFNMRTSKKKDLEQGSLRRVFLKWEALLDLMTNLDLPSLFSINGSN